MADHFDLVIRAARVITGASEAACAIGVTGGRIAAIRPVGDTATSPLTVEFGDDTVLLPGLVDSHVHVCEPGQAGWEGFATATRAAAAGGITTLVDMPLDSVPVTVSAAALAAKRRAADGQCHVDVGFWGGVIPQNLAELGGLHDAGVLGFKCFLADSGSAGFPPVDGRGLTAALGVVRGLNKPLLVHAERAEAAATGGPAPVGARYADYLASRPPELENLAIAQVIEAARATGGHAHVVHLSSADAVPMLAAARREGIRVTAESCPHYLTLAAEDIPDGATVVKCSPPVRGAANRERLWDALRDGVVGMVVSDHSPCLPAMKALDSGDFSRAWAGISSLQLGLPLVWTEASRRGFGLSDVATWMSRRPAELAGLRRKGRIAVGCDADFAVFAPDESFTVDPARLHHRHPVTPYGGWRLRGVVRDTLLRGEPVDPARPRGRLLASPG